MVNRKPRPFAEAASSPWKTLDSREVYANPWLAVTEHAVIWPDGSRNVYGIADPGDNVTIAAINDANEVLLVHDFVYPVQQWAWSLPSGAIEAHEQPQIAAARELAEEGGVIAGRWDLLGTAWLTPGISPQTSFCFLARDLTPVSARPEPTEVITQRWLPLAEAVRWCKSGEIRHATAIMTLLWVRGGEFH